MEEITLKDLEAAHYKYYVALVSFTILYYDYLLTVAWEVERVWKTSGLNWSTAFFYFNRYINLLGHIPVIFEFFWSTSSPRKFQMYAICKLIIFLTEPISSCHGLQAYHRGLSVVIQVVVACMLVMRVYALYERRPIVLVLYFCILSGAAIICAWSLTIGRRREPKRDFNLPAGCGTNMTRFFAQRCAIAWGSMFVFDVIVFSMTVYQSVVVSVPRLKDTGTSVIYVLFRDGAIYFGVIAAANLANILTFLLGSAFTRGIVTTFTNVLSSIMISRLVLKLRDPEVATHARRRTRTDEITSPELSFTRGAGTTELSQLESTWQNSGRVKHKMP